MQRIIASKLNPIPVLTPKKDAAVVTNDKRSFLEFIKYWLPVIVYAIFIFHMSSIPGEDIPSLFPFQDIAAHILEYTLFALLINRAVKAYFPGLIYGKRFVWVLFIALAYAASDEFHQSFIPGRFPALDDLLYDCMGICFANILYR